MATAVINIVEVAESNATGHSDRGEFDIFFHSNNQQITENSVSIDTINNTETTDDTSATLYSQNLEFNAHNKTTEKSHENKEKEDISKNNRQKNIVRRKYRNILDSDSEEEDNFISSLLNKSNLEKESIENLEVHVENASKVSGTTQRGKNSRRLIDSESDEDFTIVDTNIDNDDNDNNCNDGENIGNTVVKKPLKSRFCTLIHSDSEVDEESTNTSLLMKNNECEPSSESKKANVGEKKKKSKISVIVDSESDYENGSDHSAPVATKKKPASNRKKKTKVHKSKGKTKITDLDTDSEGDTKHHNIEQSSLSKSQENDSLSKKKTKRRKGSSRTAKDEAMHQIHSETQRLIRSSEVYLPYHRPKQRSLQDFLNRKQFIPVLPEGLTTAAKVKMSSEIVGKVLKEKEKEAELFYKSSDSEDETITCTPRNLNTIEEMSSSGKLVEQIAIEETQKIQKNDIQNAHKKKEIIQQGAVDLGVPRKLFLDEPIDLMENDRPTNMEINIGDDEDSAIADPRKKMKESKNGLREGSAPRKLFPSHQDKVVDSPSQNNDASITMTSDMANMETRKRIEEVMSVDEGINSLSKINEISSCSEGSGNDFVLKLPDSALADSLYEENFPEIDALVCNEPTKEIRESLNISETPFISNKEYAKLNEREKSLKHNDNFDLTSNIDDDSSERAFGHVLGLPPPDIDTIPANTTSSIKKKVLSTLSKIGPKLRGTPGMVIDLSDDVRPNKEGVKSLVDRFMRHSVVNKPTEKCSPVTVLHTEKTSDGLRMIEEILPYKLPTGDNFNDKELQKPGAKYARLKNDLIRKMATKRGEEWRLKEQQEKDENKEGIEDESESEADVRLADEEFEVTTESEPEEDDMPAVRKKKRIHREFADEEAEVSGEEEEDGDDVMEVSDDEEDEEDEEEKTLANVDHDADTSDNFSDVEEETGKKTKRLNRIVKAFEDDSNSLPDESLKGCIDCRANVFERTKTDVDMFAPENNDSWFSDTETELPPSQILPRDQADARSQLCKTPLTAINVLRFVSPITQLTALNSCTDSPKESPLSNGVSRRSHEILGLSTENTPIGVKESPISCDNEKRIGFQKKLFEEPAGTVNEEDLMDLCSGKFTCMENEDGGPIGAMRITSDDKVSETQLMSLCSGSFTSQMLDQDKYDNNVNHTVDETSQDIRLTLDDDPDSSCDIAASKETRIESKSSWAFEIATSSEDEISSELQTRGKRKILKKKKVQKLDLSDDEDEDLSNEEDDEDLVNDNEDKYIDYDSEENEVVIVPKKDMKKVAADFFEAEAELSESEWGSADEDEKDLDRFEFEEADNEEIDEDKMRDQLGKMHMRQVQDDDQREVRMLQELLFDDGDLHTEGSGRERKFKWKNIDQLGEDGTLGPHNNDGDENGGPIEEDLEDLEWRKERLEREKFIEDKMKLTTNEVIDELADDSQVFKLGMKALKKNKSSQPSQKEPEPAAMKPIVPRTVLDLVGSPSLGTRIVQKAVKRGSFLARGEECLARLAVHIKHTSETTVVARKNPGNFVFTHISPSVEDTTDRHQKDSTKEDSSDKAMARKRKSTAGMTPRSTKKAKKDITRSTGKKLF